jgi:hypothetical protein
MNFEKRQEQLLPVVGFEQITAEFPIYLGLGKDSVVDDVPGRSGDALVDVKRRIRGAVLSVGRA